MADNPYFENLFPLDDEENEQFKDMLERVLEGLNGAPIEDPFEKYLDSLWKDIEKNALMWECEGGSWKVQILRFPISYVVVVKVYDTLEVPIYECWEIEDAYTSARFAAAAMKSGCAKKLTNVFNGDIINIEIKKYGEEIDEDL
jgi:hypothetical protein